MRRSPGGGPAAAGGAGTGWRWSQTETLVRVSFPVPRGIRKSDVTLAVTDNSLRLTLRDFAQPLLDGPLWGRVNALKARQRGHKLTKSGRVAVTLEKLDRVPWKQLFREGVTPIAANYAALTPPPPQRKLLVVYDYDAEAPNELTIKEHDIVNLIAEDPSGWWKGELNGAVGLFPSNFSQPHEEGPEQLDDDSDEEESPGLPALPALPPGAVPTMAPQTPGGAPSNELMAKLQRRTAVLNGPAGGAAPAPTPAPREQAPAPGGNAAAGPFGGRGQPSKRDIARQSTPGQAGPGAAPRFGTGAPPVGARAQSSFGAPAAGAAPEERPRGGVAAAAAALSSSGGGAPPPGGVSLFGGAPPPGGVSPFGGASLRSTAPTASAPPPAGGEARRPPPPARIARPALSVSEPAPEVPASSPFSKLRRAVPPPAQQEEPSAPSARAVAAPSVVIEEPAPEPETPVEANAPPGTVALAKVLHDYQATANEELSFAEGDTIYVLVKDDSGWWQGTVNGQTGWFPANYAEEVPFDPSSVSSTPDAMLSSDESVGNDELLSVADKLADMDPGSARLATPKRAMGASNRRRPSRSKRVARDSTTSVVSSVLSSVPAAAPSAAAPAAAPAATPAFRSNLRKTGDSPAGAAPAAAPAPSPSPAVKDESSPGHAPLKKSPTLAGLVRTGNAPEGLGALPSRQATSPLLTRGAAPDAALPAAGAASQTAPAEASPTPSSPEPTPSPDVVPAKWPSQQLGEYSQFCADVWAMLESSAGASGLGFALCATDGTTFSRGSFSQQPLALGQCAFPFLQAIAISQLGARAVSGQVGSEPAPFGEVLSLNTEKKPHNGLTSAGALKLASLLYAAQDAPSRIAQLLQSFAAFAGVPHLSCSMSAYLSLRASSNKDYAMAYWLKSCSGLDGEVVPTLEFFFQACAVEVSCETLAVMAATLANSGSCPSSHKQAANADAADTVTNQLASCCGLAEFNEPPAQPIAIKTSATSACAFIVVPGVMGIAVVVPPASVASLGKFCKLLSSKYPSLHSIKPS